MHPQEQSGSVSFMSYDQVVADTPFSCRFPPRSLFARLNSSITQCLSSQVLCLSSRFAGLLRTRSSMSKFLIYWRPPNWACYSRCSLTNTEGVNSLDLLPADLANTIARMLLVFPATMSHCWLNFFSVKTARSVSEKLFPSQPQSLLLH